jgi:iron uptake system component EfeO
VRRVSIVPVLVPALILGIAACSSPAAKGDGVAITATDTTCEVATTTFAPGTVKFNVTNKGSKVTEVYVYAEKSRIVTEVENIGPGTSRDLSAELTPGTYEIACKPGQTGDGIRQTITVTGSVSAAPPTSSAPARAYDYELEVTVAADGVHTSGPVTVAVGQSVEFKLENKTSGKRELEIIDPNGKEVAAIEAAANGAAETVVKLTLPGEWKLKIEGSGVPDVIKTFAVA